MDDTSSLGWAGPGSQVGAAALVASDEAWPIEPDPALTALQGRQIWRFADGVAVSAEIGGVRLAPGDARIAQLGIRRDRAGRPFPAAFAHSPATGAPLPPPEADGTPEFLDIDPDSAAEIPLPSGVPTLAAAGRPAGLFLFQENLGALEAWDGRAFATLGRLPPAPGGTILASGPQGIAYTTDTALVAVPLPQLGPELTRVVARLEGLRFVSGPAWSGADLVALGLRGGRLVLCRLAAGSDALRLTDLGGAEASGLPGSLSGPWTNRLGDAFWTGPDGFVTCPAGSNDAAFTPWPAGFAPLAGLAPWRDRADRHHQLGMAEGRYHYAAIVPDAALARQAGLRRLDGPHLAAGDTTYCGGERFDLPWQDSAETLNLGAHAGSLLVPLLPMARDTILLALDIPGPRAAFLRGRSLPAPLVGHVLHHAHGVGLRRLPVGLAVAGLGDAGAVFHAGVLYLWSRSERRCHALRLRAA